LSKSDKTTLFFISSPTGTYQRQRLELMAERFLASGSVNKTYLCDEHGQKGSLKKFSDYLLALKTLLFSRADRVVLELSGFLPFFICLATLKSLEKIVIVGVLGQDWQNKKLSFGKKLIRFFSTKMSSLLIVSTEKDMALLMGRDVAEPSNSTVVMAFPPPSEFEFEAGLTDKEVKKLIQERDGSRSALCEMLELPEKSLILLSLSPLVIEQSLETVIRALADTGKKTFLIIAGDGPDRSRILSLIVGLGLTEQVVLLGEDESRANLVKAVDVLVVPKAYGYEDSVLDAVVSGTGMLLGGGEELLTITEEEQIFDPTHVGELSLKLQELSGRKSALEDNMRTSLEAALRLKKDWAEDISSLFLEKKV